MASDAEVVFNTIVPPGLTPFLAQFHDAGIAARGGQLVCTYFDENSLNLVPAEHVEGLTPDTAWVTAPSCRNLKRSKRWGWLSEMTADRRRRQVECDRQRPAVHPIAADTEGCDIEPGRRARRYHRGR
jgi:hypothetical protein